MVEEACHGIGAVVEEGYRVEYWTLSRGAAGVDGKGLIACVAV